MNVDQSKTTLICLPFAGGSKFAFHRLEAYLSAFCQVKTIELPGRGTRFAEPLLLSADLIVADAWKQIRPWITDAPYAFLGHSMGSWLTFLMAHEIRKAGLQPPSHLFLSGREAPSIPASEPPDYLLSAAAFKAKLKSYGGFDAQILENEEAYAFFEPIIRADFQVLETWKYQPQMPLDIPATVLSGTNEDITEAELRAWSLEFNGEIRFKKFEGDHFFLFEHAEAFSNIIKQRLFEGTLN
jgi:hypothetical protein